MSEDDSQSNPHHEAGLCNNQMGQNSGPEDGHDKLTGVRKESLCGHDMVTRATEQNRNCHDMTGDHEEVTYCSSSTSSGKQKKTGLDVIRNSSLKTPLRQLRQTKLCWPSSI